MRFTEAYENIKISLDAMWANKLRSFLSSLGVMIGISFVILMGWVIGALDQVMEDTFNMIGTDMMYIDKYDWTGGTKWSETRYRKAITLDQTEELMERMTSAEIVYPQARQWRASINYGGFSYSGIPVIGTTVAHSKIPSGTIEKGRHFTAFEDRIGSHVIVLGSKAAKSILKDKKDPIGAHVKIRGRKFEVIGILKKQGTMIFDVLDNQVFIPLHAFSKLYSMTNRSINIGVKAGSTENMENVRDEAQGILRTIRNVKPGDKDDFSINESKAFEKNIQPIRIGVWGVGIGMTFLSFFVGIIGIMNIMFVSVSERTKEIGIRKALGAKKSSIATQFISESAFLCIMGAIISFIVCSGFVFLVATIAPNFNDKLAFLPKTIPFYLLIIASLVSLLLGVIAGSLPAFRAAALDPVEAIRSE